MRHHELVRKGAFWLAVAGVAVLANFMAETVTGGLAERGKCPPGLAKFVAFSHRGAS